MRRSNEEQGRRPNEEEEGMHRYEEQENGFGTVQIRCVEDWLRCFYINVSTVMIVMVITPFIRETWKEHRNTGYRKLQAWLWPDA